MGEPSEASLLERAREATSRGDWGGAHALLTEADDRAPLSGPHLAFLAEVAYAAGHLDVTIEAWERAHAEGLRTGDELGAAGAAVRVAMHLLFDSALMAPVRGWLARAERLLGDRDQTPVHAWLAAVRSYERLLTGDVQSAGEWAQRAIQVGSSCEQAAAAIGRVAYARTLILGGDVRQGLALLEEAGVAAVSGELDTLSSGVVYCELVCALQGLAQYDLADEWTQAMERWRRANAIGSFPGRCRVHRAEILRMRGSYAEAEKEALLACEELRPYLRRELGWPLNELGRIRLLKGDLAGAEEAFLATREAAWDPEPGLALVRLAQGNVEQAVASIRDALEHPSTVPSKELPPNTELRRAPLLAAQVEIEVAAGHLDRARAAADELERVAARFEGKALTASAALARGRILLAEGDPVAARRHFESAAQLWNEVGAPHEVALARVGIADAQRAEGNEERAVVAVRAGGTIHERDGAFRDARRRPDAEDGGERAGAPAARLELFRREGDYWSVAFEGRTVRLRDLKGMRYLARLLAEPGREFHVVDLVVAESDGALPVASAAEPGLASSLSGDAGELLDARAKTAYRRRLAEIEEDLEEARAIGDVERARQAEAERDFLVRELSRAIGLGGRERRAGSSSERARASVTRAVRQAMNRIHEHHGPLGEHLDRAVRTGTYCSYLPDPRAPVAWKL